MCLSALVHNIFASLYRAWREQPELAFNNLDVFEHHDGIGAGGNRSAAV